MTQSISLYDCTLVTMKSMDGTPAFDWSEETPNSDKVTRVLGTIEHYVLYSLFDFIWTGVIMAEESDKVLVNALLWLQRQQERLKEGFMVEYNETEYVFLPDYVDRLVHTFKNLGGYSGDTFCHTRAPSWILS